MNLDKLQVNACIRSGWQALDLGFLMARAWLRPLFIASLMPMLPLTVLLMVIFIDNPFWTVLVLWWLKPFWERLPLFIASRMLFDEAPGIWSSMKSLPLKDILPWLLWRRFSMQRAFDNPITVLEGLKGGERRERLRVLHGKYTDVALSNQFVCFCCELLVAFGLLVLFDFFTPDALDINFYDTFGDLTVTGERIFSLTAILAMAIVMPFHSMAGFALYLNRRIELEAWDIEISFRNLAERKRSTQGRSPILPAVILLFGLFGLGTPGGADAAVQHDRESAAELIEQVLQGKDFGEDRNVRKWRFKDFSEEQEDSSFPEWIIDFYEWLEGREGWWEGLGSIAFLIKVLLVVLFAGLLFYLLRRYRGPLSRLAQGQHKETAPEVLFGLDVTPESLPPDVPEQAIRLWGEGAYREALSLLYRASLSRLIERYELAFRASHTEAECAALVKAYGVESLSDYFWQLTQTWRRLAYGHQLPSDDTLRGLCDGWTRELSSDQG